MLTHDSPFGVLTWDDPCWESAPVSLPLLGGDEVVIQIFGEEEDETAPIRPDRFEALERLFALTPDRAHEIRDHLWAYYLECADELDPPLAIAGPADVLNYIRPATISPERGEDGAVYVSIEGECDWEIEHGLQLVLQHGDRWVRVSSYDGHLTDGHAYGRSTLDAWIKDPQAKLPVRTIEEIVAEPED